MSGTIWLQIDFMSYIKVLTRNVTAQRQSSCVCMMHLILRVHDKYQTAVLVLLLLDLSNVDHNILISTLETYIGVVGKARDWFKSCLSASAPVNEHKWYTIWHKRTEMWGSSRDPFVAQTYLLYTHSNL